MDRVIDQLALRLKESECEEARLNKKLNKSWKERRQERLLALAESSDYFFFGITPNFFFLPNPFFRTYFRKGAC